MFQNLRQIDNSTILRDGASLVIITTVGISFLLANAVANVINKIYNKNDGAE